MSTIAACPYKCIFCDVKCTTSEVREHMKKHVEQNRLDVPVDVSLAEWKDARKNGYVPSAIPDQYGLVQLLNEACDEILRLEIATCKHDYQPTSRNYDVCTKCGAIQ